MTQEEKDLLLKDLCGRLQYGLKCSIYRVDDFGVGWRDATFNGIIRHDIGYEFYFDDYVCVDSINKVKPYLFPLSSMTDEQRKEYIDLCTEDTVGGIYYLSPDSANWLDAHHFDYRGLIHIGLAIDATGKNIY